MSEKDIFLKCWILPLMGVDLTNAHAQILVVTKPHKNSKITVLSCKDGVRTTYATFLDRLHPYYIFQRDGAISVKIFIDWLLDDFSCFNVQHSFSSLHNNALFAVYTYWCNGCKLLQHLWLYHTLHKIANLSLK